MHQHLVPAPKPETAKEREERLAREAQWANSRKIRLNNLLASSTADFGHVESEVLHAMRMREKTGLQDGDWLDDPVAAFHATGSGAFGEEVKTLARPAVHVNVGLDASHSMWQLGLAEAAWNAFRYIFYTLSMFHDAHPTAKLTVTGWLFAYGEEDKRYKVKAGSKVRKADWERAKKDIFAITNQYGRVEPTWSGEDTYIAPFLEELLAEDEKHPGCYIQDLIITDAVLQHPMDVREASKVQQTRMMLGSVNTILLNFQPQEDALKYPVPSGAVQYYVSAMNLLPMLKQLLGTAIV